MAIVRGEHIHLMNLNLKDHLIGLATSKQVKELVCDLLDQMAENSDNKLDDRAAKGVRAALLDDG